MAEQEKNSPTEVAKTYCRICAAFCGYEAVVEDGKITKLRADRSDPVSDGYACFKGLRHLDLQYGNQRLLKSKQMIDGSHVDIDSDEALEAAGTRLRAIIDQHGAESVGFFMGTQCYFNTPIPIFISLFAAALQTPRVFQTMTIDQSAKWIGHARIGKWKGGIQDFDRSDVWMFAGSNPYVTMVADGGGDLFAFPHPQKKLKRFKERGGKLIVIDPRKTETAKFADLHLQLKPGRDAELAAAILHVIFRESWFDEEFCRDYVDGVVELNALVEPFAPEAVADVIGVSADDITRAAKMFAYDAKSGMVGTGTGPDMARRSNTSEHLYQAINIICGRFPRDGEQYLIPGVLSPKAEVSADVIPPFREWDHSAKSLRNNLGQIKGTLMSAEITGEILADDPKKMRAMICVGGNLATALPDQKIANEALSALELLIVIDPLMTATGRHADFIIAPKTQYERADHTGSLERLHSANFAHITDALVEPPTGADVVDEWIALLKLAHSAGVQIDLGQGPIDAINPPSTQTVLRMIASGSSVPFDTALAADGAEIFDEVAQTIAERQTEERFQIVPEDVKQEIVSISEELTQENTKGEQRFQLIVRRHKEFMNSTGTSLESQQRLFKFMPAYLHSHDMRSLSLKDGDLLSIESKVGRLNAHAKTDDTMRPGTIAHGHGWSTGNDDKWAATNRLVDRDEGAEAINHMPIMTGLPVDVQKV